MSRDTRPSEIRERRVEAEERPPVSEDFAIAPAVDEPLFVVVVPSTNVPNELEAVTVITDIVAPEVVDAFDVVLDAPLGEELESALVPLAMVSQ